MNTPALEQVYIDTNILINYALGKEKVQKEKDFVLAKEVFESATSGKYKIAISNFMLSETLHALRNIATQSAFKQLVGRISHRQLIDIVNSKNFQDEINRESMDAFLKVVDRITRDPKHFSLETEKGVYVGTLFREGLAILMKTFGDFRVFGYRCRRCDGYMKCDNCGITSEIKYKAVNAPDLTHISIACNMGCSRFLTMDKYFEKIAGDVPIKIEILRSN